MDNLAGLLNESQQVRMRLVRDFLDAQRAEGTGGPISRGSTSTTSASSSPLFAEAKDGNPR